VQPGDLLHPIGVCDEVLYVPGRTRVQQIIPVYREAERLLDEATARGDFNPRAQFTRILSRDFGQWRITVNAVSPGATETETYRDGKSEQFLASLEAMSSFGRLGQPAEIAAVVAFLAIRVNGGTA
jgi:hypothetical protein